MSDRFDPVCWADHLAQIWCIEPSRFDQYIEAYRAGFVSASLTPQQSIPGMEITGRIARIPITGPMMKGRSKFGGTSTADVRRALAEAVGDKGVGGIMIHADSPGGMVAGTAELADDVRAASVVKPVHVHIDDLGASALYYVASQADHISVNRAGEVGSIGVYAVLVDSSGMAEREGLKVRVVKSAPFKGAGEQGVPLSDDDIDDMQERVNRMGEMFKAAVKAGRGFNAKQLAAVTDGRVYGSDQALEMGLVDRVWSFAEAMANLEEVVVNKQLDRDVKLRRRLALARNRGHAFTLGLTNSLRSS